MSKQLVVANTHISTDAEGRFRLNDLHKASGGEDRHAPAKWDRLDQTKDLVSLLEEQTGQMCLVSKEGRNGGTYALKELVYAYAMWISPSFHLHVIRAFDAMVTGQQKFAKPEKTPSGAQIKATMELMGYIQATLPNLSDASKQAMLSTATEALYGRPLVELPRIEERHFTATEVGEMFGVSSNVIGRLATRNNLKTADYGYMRVQKRASSEGQCKQFVYNSRGVTEIERLMVVE